MTNGRHVSGDGGGFLLQDPEPASTTLPDDLDPHARAIGRTVDEFWKRDVAAALPALDAHEPGAARSVLKKAAALGLTAMQVPERYGGLALDLPSVIVGVEHIAEDPSYQGWHLGHSSLGTLPLVYYGNEAQKQRYLPKLISTELLGAFALTEPHAGSDALAARTRADLSADGRHYILNGQKAWITNGGEADLFTVFANVGGQAFTAFLVERAFGVRSGAEEKKMGLQGTSTTAVYFDAVRVPVENVLGEIGKGQRVALNTLNCARLEMGPIALRGAKRAWRAAAEYAESRQAFGRSIDRFGAIQQKLADMAVRVFAAESAVWRAVSRIQAEIERSDLAHEAAEVAALEAHAVECAIVKVHASEMLDRVVDEAVQIHGGYGFHRDYAVERMYRDARVNRIFEGTNEINRQVIPTLLLRRSHRGRLPLLATPQSLPAMPGSDASGSLGSDIRVSTALRLLTVFAMRLAHERYREALAEQQEVVMRLADLAIETFVIQSVVTRGHVRLTRGDASAEPLARLYVHDALPRLSQAALEIAGALPASYGVDVLVDRARRWLRQEPIDAIALRRVVFNAGRRPEL